MAPKRPKQPRGKAHRFGGDWTTAKLDVLANYLASYTTALKDKPSKDHRSARGTSTRSRERGIETHGVTTALEIRRNRCCFPTSRSRRLCSMAQLASR
jgi:hypothetical protein